MHKPAINSLLGIFFLTHCAEPADEPSGTSNDGDVGFRAGSELAKIAARGPLALDPRRSVFETNVSALAPFSLKDVLGRAASNAGVKATPKRTYRRLIDTYNSGDRGVFPDGQHCDDDYADPRFTNPNDIPCGLLGCDSTFFCAKHDVDCSECRADGSVCRQEPGFENLPTEVCAFGRDGTQVCTFTGRSLVECRASEGDECDEAGCPVFGCDSVQMCTIDSQLCIVCRADLSECVVDQGVPSSTVESVCSFGDFEGTFDMCDFHTETGQVDNCRPDFACEQAACGELGCNTDFLCTDDGSFCVNCTASGDRCLVVQGAPTQPIEPMCSFSSQQRCQFDSVGLSVGACVDDATCEAIVCGPLGCNPQQLCTPDFNQCAICSQDGQNCIFFDPIAPGTLVCSFDTGDVCVVNADNTVSGCVPDTSGLCDGFGDDDGGDVDGDDGDTTGMTTFGSTSTTTSATASSSGGSISGTGTGGTSGTGGDGGTTGGDFGDDFGDTTADDATGDDFGDFGDESQDSDDGDDDEGGGGATFGALGDSLLECPRVEAGQIGNLDQWFPIAVSSRLDLAPTDGANCGQQRIVFGNNEQNRMFVILEAQIPNPRPGKGIAGCRPLAEFWAGQSEIDSPEERGVRLAEAFLTGHRDLKKAGFKPFVNWKNYSFGGGQVRTNNFDQDPWTLREFKLVKKNVGRGKKEIQPVQVPVTYSPEGDHWNDALDTPRGEECRHAFLEAIDGLLTDEPDAMSFVLPEFCMAAESRDDGRSDFALQLMLGTGQFESDIARHLDVIGSDLTPADIARRAQFAGACIGCHEQSNFQDLGHGVQAPFSAGFTHSVEFSDDCPSGEQGSCFGISDALEDSFLPHRLRVLQSLLGVSPAPEASVAELSAPEAIADELRAVHAADGLVGRVDVAALHRAERRARAKGAKFNIGGGSAQSTH